MMKMTFRSDPDDVLREKDRHISILPEEKVDDLQRLERSLKREEHKQLRLETRRANLALIRK